MALILGFLDCVSSSAVQYYSHVSRYGTNSTDVGVDREWRGKRPYVVMAGASRYDTAALTISAFGNARRNYPEGHVYPASRRHNGLLGRKQ